MTIKDYQKYVKDGASEKYSDPSFAALALVGEVGEVCDEIKKRMIYIKSNGFSNILEELGDVFWQYIALIQSFGYTLDDIMESNVAKLKLRHGKKKLDLTGGKR